MSTPCALCPHHCRLAEGGIGLCRARIGRAGRSAPLGYGRLTSLALDPIEKKPLSRYLPGSMILSAGSFGCNMRCFFCQNCDIAMAGQEVDTEYWPSERLVDQAQSLRFRGNIGLAFTYNEPLLNPEYIADCARLLRAADMGCVVVTNGCFCLDAVGFLLPQVDAFNIVLKGFTEGWYQRLGGDLETVKAFIQAAHQHSHVELATLIVPGENDSEQEIEALAAWVASLSPDIPLHLSRFFPRHQAQDRQPTDKAALLRLCEVASRHLNHVIPGNL